MTLSSATKRVDRSNPRSGNGRTLRNAVLGDANPLSSKARRFRKLRVRHPQTLGAHLAIAFREVSNAPRADLRNNRTALEIDRRAMGIDLVWHPRECLIRPRRSAYRSPPMRPRR